MAQKSGSLEELGVPPGRLLLADRANSWLAIVSVVLGILGLLVWLVASGLGSDVVGLVAAVTGLSASNQITRSRDTQKGQTAAVAGLVLGLVAVVWGIVALGAWGLEPGFRVLQQALGF